VTDKAVAGIVIGGGVAGLAFAVAMQRHGQHVVVLESAPTLRATGSGLVLGPTAIRALKSLGIADDVISAGQILATGGLADLALKPLSQDAFGHFTKQTGEPFVGVERGTLIRLLANRTPTCRTNTRYTSISENDREVAVTLADGDVLRGPWVVLADGIRSSGRSSFATANIRDAKQWCWRGIAEGVDLGRFRHSYAEAWGSEWRFGLTPVGGGKTYWFMTQRDNRGAVQSFPTSESRARYLQAAASQTSPLLSQLVSATPRDQILENRLEDLAPLSRWHSARTVCIGDSAHAMTPNLGQGATQALEDAVILAKMIAQGDGNLNDTFSRFETIRRPRAERTVREARMLGRLAHAPRVVTGLRNAILKSLPRTMSLKQLSWLYEDRQLFEALS
jgi:2-polyprenyl-6-methoxyphenol hydroxylase-like FAD-dependent oxidoreductase